MTQQQFPIDAACRSWARRSGLVLLLCLLSGCHAFDKEPATDKETASTAAPIPGPGKYHHRESQYVFYSDFPLKPNLPLFKELSDLRDQVCKELQLPPSNTLIQVFLFEDQAKYEAYMKSRYSYLPLRRAFFVKQQHNDAPDDLFVFTWWGEKIRQDLRHELTHGILHSVCKDVPIWLDEGLAEIYELPPESNGVNTENMEAIISKQFHPDLARLEQLTDVKHMLKPEYREAWAWVHFMLRGSPETKPVLLAYLQQLRSPNPPPALLPKLKEVHSAPNDALFEHLARIELPRAHRLVNAEQR